MKTDLSRITIDVPKEIHKRIKSKAALSGKTIKEYILEAVIEHEEFECTRSHKPNKKTLKAIESSLKEENLIRGKEAEKLTKKLGFKNVKSSL